MSTRATPVSVTLWNDVFDDLRKGGAIQEMLGDRATRHQRASLSLPTRTPEGDVYLTIAFHDEGSAKNFLEQLMESEHKGSAGIDVTFKDIDAKAASLYLMTVHAPSDSKALSHIVHDFESLTVRGALQHAISVLDAKEFVLQNYGDDHPKYNDVPFGTMMSDAIQTLTRQPGAYPGLSHIEKLDEAIGPGAFKTAPRGATPYYLHGCPPFRPQNRYAAGAYTP
jgi:hypothetical protein